MHYAFIGGGNMATSLVGGLRARGVPADRITVAEPVAAQRERLHHEFGVIVTPDNAAAAREADTIVLCVKPQEMASAARGIAGEFAARRRIVISIAAGIRVEDLARWLGPTVPVVRTMPNRPALIGAGITAMYAGDAVEPVERKTVEDLLGACGATVWVEDEALLDVVTAVSGTGPAYFFFLIEMLEATGIQLGLAPDAARRLAVETARGAGRMAAETSESPQQLREEVTSKGGTTAAAMQVLEAAGVRAIFAEAITAAARRSAELARQFGSH